MSDQNLPSIDFTDIPEDVLAAAVAAAAGNAGYLTPPADAKETKDKNGKVYKRWAPEGAVIETAYREPGKQEKPEDRLLTVVVQLKIRGGFPHQHERTWARFTLSPQIMQGKEPLKPSHKFMHERSLGTIASLLGATGFKPKTGGLSGKVMNHMFPATKGSTSSPIVGKDVMVNFCDQPNTGVGAKTERQTSADSFLPYAPPPVKA